MTLQGILQSLVCSFTGTRCLFCNREVCAFHPNGNPFIGTKYREVMEHIEQKKVGGKK